MKKFKTKDSGERITYDSGMNRDIENDKPRYDLIDTKLLNRLAWLLKRGADKYTARNWEKANSLEELKRFKASAWRHFIQYMDNETDEDHFAATVFNIMAIEFLKNKIGCDLNGEWWQKTPILKNYEVSNIGNIRRIKDNKIMKQWSNCWGYKLVSLSNENKKHYQVHRLIASAFIGEAKDLQVNHKDGKKDNNNYLNLEYLTAKENNKHARDLGLWKPTQKGKITFEIAEEIKIRIANKEKQIDLAKEFGLSQQTICDINKGRIWKKNLSKI